MTEGSGGDISMTGDGAVVEDLVHARIDDAFSAWIDPAQVEVWWGPDGFRTEVLRLEPHAGGVFEYRMTAPSGAACVMRGSFLEVERPSRLVLEITDHCNLDLPAGVEPQTLPTRVIVEFLQSGRATRIRLQHLKVNGTYALLAGASWQMSLRRMPQGDATMFPDA